MLTKLSRGRGGTSSRRMAPALLGLLLCAAAAVASPPYVDLRKPVAVRGDAAAGQAKAALCQACHFPNGGSVGPLVPHLAGQRIAYLYYTLKEFKRAAPKDPYYGGQPMSAVVTTVTDADLADLAAFYASQTPSFTPPGPVPASGSRGEAIFLHGDPEHGVPACQGCHGAHAAGPASSTGQYAAYPSLRGQPADYVKERLKHFRDQLPRNTSNDFIMGGVAHELDDATIDAIAGWLESLPTATGS